MEDFTLDVVKRVGAGSAVARRLRTQGLVPSVIYHKGEESVPVSINLNDFIKKARVALSSQVFKVNCEDKTLNGRTVIVREIQKDHSLGKDKIVHVDLQALKDDEEIRLNIKLKIMGEAPGVKLDGGILSVVSHQVGILCLPRDIPKYIEVDISSLALGHSIHAKDLKLSTGVRLADDPEQTMVSVVVPKTVKEETPAATAVDGAAAAAAPAAGAAPAAAGGAAAKAPAAAAKAPAKGK